MLVAVAPGARLCRAPSRGRERLAAAQERLEATDEPVGRMAAACGFGSAASLRAHFGPELRTSPLAYRRAFRATSETA